jgi:hypothetical protein
MKIIEQNVADIQGYTGEGIPPFLTGTPGGYCTDVKVFLNYDNVIVMGPEGPSRRVFDGIIASFTAQNVVIKDEPVFLGFKKLRSESIIHLGMAINVANKTTILRHKSTRKWLHLASKRIVTKRHLARAIGVMLYDQRLRNQPLQMLAWAIDLIVGMHPVKDWNDPVAIEESCRQKLAACLQYIVANFPTKFPHKKMNHETFFLATDASMTAGGWTLLDEHGGLLAFRTVQVPTAHIYILEMLAVKIGISQAREWLGNDRWCNARIVLCCDNTAVVHCLRREFTLIHSVRDAVNNITRNLREANAFSINSIPGIVNPADEPSRLRLPLETKCLALPEIVNKLKAGPPSTFERASSQEDAWYLLEPIELISISGNTSKLSLGR